MGMGPELEPLRDFEFLSYDPQPEESHSSAAAPVSVRRDAYWSYCGPVLPAADDGLPANFHEWAATALSGSFAPLFVPFLAFANAFLARHGLHHYWLTIRATTPTGEYDKTRWHTDDMFFSSSGASTSTSSTSRSTSTGKRSLSSARLFRRPSKRKLDLCTDWKICATLLGQPTMFVPLEHQDQARKRQRFAKKTHSKEHDCNSIRCVGCASAADAVRDDLATNLVGLGAVQATAGQCVVFRIGADKGAMHSEPKMSEGGRIFVNIIPGSEEELSRLATKWGMEFPRSWWISSRAMLLSNNENKS